MAPDPTAGPARPPRARFVVLDGVDGCGKSTQAARLAARLGAGGDEVVHLRDPGTTPEGERIRALLLDREATLSSGVEALLFCAARRQLLERAVAPALARGAHVVCERFHPSTFAYQAVAGGLDEGALLDLLHGWAGEPAPDLTVLLELDPARAAARRAGPGDRIEDRGLAFQRAVAVGLARYAERAPGPVVRVDADAELARVEERVWEEVRRVL